jgi:S-adenosylmethionine:tRNA ribosyltransferase-isomerase
MNRELPEQDALTAAYLYPLPAYLIAHHPADRRDQSRLMIVRGHQPVEHRLFSDLTDYLRAGDCLVVNDTRVIPARLYGKRAKTGGAVELLLLAPLGGGRWRSLVKPGRNARPGERIVFADGQLEALVEEVEPDGSRLINFDYKGDFMALLDEIGEMPLPPYIHEKLEDPERYQTVYSAIRGSAAAPTAGLHFTDQLLDRVRAMGVTVARVTLHVGLATFRPVKEERIRDHVMHREPFTVSKETLEIIKRTKEGDGRVIAVGTTSLRVLESLDGEGAKLPERAVSGETDLFIYPGFQFRLVDGLITNFHLPGSTLLMLVSALMGRERILDAYRLAVDQGYRFFSFGDAMLLLPQRDLK